MCLSALQLFSFPLHLHICIVWCCGYLLHLPICIVWCGGYLLHLHICIVWCGGYLLHLHICRVCCGGYILHLHTCRVQSGWYLLLLPKYRVGCTGYPLKDTIGCVPTGIWIRLPGRDRVAWNVIDAFYLCLICQKWNE